jgi:cyclopropane fatty-acyl-phospholipid synthase-like methyltransferase
MNPVSPAATDAVVGALELPAAACVLDVGCGRGSLLFRVVERYGCRAVGIDLDAALLA